MRVILKGWYLFTQVNHKTSDAHSKLWKSSIYKLSHASCFLFCFEIPNKKKSNYDELQYGIDRFLNWINKAVIGLWYIYIDHYDEDFSSSYMTQLMTVCSRWNIAVFKKGQNKPKIYSCSGGHILLCPKERILSHS